MKKNLKQLGGTVGLDIKVIKHSNTQRKVIRVSTDGNYAEVQVPFDKGVLASESARPLLAIAEYLEEDNTDNISDPIMAVASNAGGRGGYIQQKLMKVVNMIEKGMGE